MSDELFIFPLLARRYSLHVLRDHSGVIAVSNITSSLSIFVIAFV